MLICLTHRMGASEIGHSPYSSSSARELRACCRAFCSLLLAFLFFIGRLCAVFWSSSLTGWAFVEVFVAAMDFFSTDALRLPDPAMLLGPRAGFYGRSLQHAFRGL